MSRVWLVLDVNYLSWRAFHAFGGLRMGSTGTGSTFGVLRDIIGLQSQHATTNIVFCFDHGKRLKRQEVFPDYKKKRKSNLTEEQKAKCDEVRKQIHLLKTQYLPYLGYENVFYQDGYEADDVIASVCQSLPIGDESIIVSADKDLYQLLDKRTFIWRPSEKNQNIYSVNHFTAEYGVTPDQWAQVKAIAGCSTDEVPGLKGVGEKTAAKYVSGGKVNDGAREKIEKWLKSGQYRLSRDLVRLPYTGTKDFTPVSDEVDVKRWKKLTERLGMKSLVNSAPRPIEGFGIRPMRIKRSGE